KFQPVLIRDETGKGVVAYGSLKRAGKRTWANIGQQRRVRCTKLLCNLYRPAPAQRQCDPNGIRTRVTAVKGRSPRPLDDRVIKPGNIGIPIVWRKANWQLNLEYGCVAAL